MLEQAAREHGFALDASVMIGDSESDVVAGHAAGCRTIRIGTSAESTSADARAETILEAATIVRGWAW
jgi:D-glycero-D-manno-heptose 1,7-bisphosphate phosphatase